MAMALPRPSTCGTRPAYLDNLFRQPSHSEPPSRREPYKSMPHSSASSLDLRSQFSRAETLPPPYESDEDKGSVRSLRLNLSKGDDRQCSPGVEEWTDYSPFEKPVKFKTAFTSETTDFVWRHQSLITASQGESGHQRRKCPAIDVTISQQGIVTAG
ncbi:hypothetical protein KC338_g235 [Hortaea werneckii]|nr:hypothetical protein KC338_g235 [Hortaea werneckii]